MAKSKLGILGLGNYSTTFYINEINRQYQSKHNIHSTCPFVLFNTDFNTVNPYLPNDFSTLIPNTKRYLNELIALGATHIIVPNITLHQTIDKIKDDLPIGVQIIHPVYTTIKTLMAYKINSVVVFGSLYTMTSNYINTLLQTFGIQSKTIPNSHKTQIDQMRKQLYLNANNPKAIAHFTELLNYYKNQHNIMLACTELSMALKTNETKIFDMARHQIASGLAVISNVS